MNFNFRYAELHGGYTYLRYDDTNPEAEEPKYFDRYAAPDRQLSSRATRFVVCSLRSDPGVGTNGAHTRHASVALQHPRVRRVARLQVAQDHGDVGLL